MAKLYCTEVEVEVIVNSREKNSEHYCLDFVQEFGLRTGNNVFSLLLMYTDETRKEI
jgi:hypothetical protein